MFLNHYQGKRVLVTGHTGFKGAWLSLWLKQLGARVIGLSQPAPTQPSLHELVGAHACEREIICDIRDAGALQAGVAAAQPDVILHLAASPRRNRWYQYVDEQGKEIGRGVFGSLPMTYTCRPSSRGYFLSISRTSACAGASCGW